MLVTAACPARKATLVELRVSASDEDTQRRLLGYEVTASVARLVDRGNGVFYDSAWQPLQGARSASPFFRRTFVPEDPSRRDTLHIKVMLRLRTDEGAEASVEQDAEVYMDEERAVVLDMRLISHCAGVICPSSLTCGSAGVCVGITRRSDGSESPPVDGGGPDVTDGARDVGDARGPDVSDGAFDASDGASDVVDASVDADAGGPDVASDPENCGRVGNLCANLERCSVGTCVGGLGVAQVALSNQGGCARMSDGTIRCWGGVECADRVPPTARDPYRPSRVLRVRGAEQIAVARDSVCWLVGGTPQCCGSLSGIHALESLRDVDEVGAGDTHVCARIGAAVYCAGSNVVGQRGAISTTDAAPNRVDLPTGVVARSLHVGGNNACVIDATGAVYCWGQSGHLQLGVAAGTACPGALPDGCPTPRRVEGVSGAALFAIDGNGENAGACVVRGDHRLLCWGTGEAVAHGVGVSSVEVPTVAHDLLAAPLDLARGRQHGCYLAGDHTLRCWGATNYGQVGAPTSSTALNAPDPATANPALPTGVERVVASGNQTCAVLSDGGVQCFGENTGGRLGTGSSSGDAVTTPRALAW